MAQVSIRWLLQKKVVSSVIIGANKMTQFEDNMGAANGWSLTEEEVGFFSYFLFKKKSKFGF